MIYPERVDIFGIKVSAIDLNSATKFLAKNIFNEPGYVCFPSTSIISLSYSNSAFQNILNSSIISFADGKFTEYYARMKGYNGIRNVSGYWLIEKLLQTNRTHYFYGCDDDTLKKLKHNLEVKFPKANIIGYKAPPFVDIEEIVSNEQIAKDFEEINKIKPDFIWIGIGYPKQEILMHYYKNKLEYGIMFGVGAVFLYHAGVINKGPEFLKFFALRWIFRLIQEPKRLIKRNTALPGIAKFLYLILKHDILRLKKIK